MLINETDKKRELNQDGESLSLKSEGAIGISFVVPKLFTAIAFDAGGVASGPMTATFLLPLAQRCV